MMNKTKNNQAQRDDALTAYFDQIKNTPLLTSEEEHDLSRRIQAGDEAAKSKLIESNLRLVVKIAKSYVTSDVTFIDLVQEGNLGLIKAASKFDYRRNVRFSTYASWWIKQSITRALSNKRRQIRLPHRKEDALRRIQKTFNLLSQRMTRTPTVEEVAGELGIEPKEVTEILNISSAVVSLDSDINEESGTFHDIFEDFSYAPDKELMKRTMREETLQFLERLKKRERQILLYRFAFYGGQKYTLKRISDEMGISPETVRQIEIRALKKLKDQAGELSDYVYG
ncbi:MAG: sigma-70 family RNA polymerase sigma factor [Spirochaetota bacterium]